MVLLNDPLDSAYLRPPQSTTPLYSHWVQPEFCYSVVTRNVYVLGFVTIARIEVEAIRSFSEYDRHYDSNLGSLVKVSQAKAELDEV